MSLDETIEVGAISKQYAGFINEAFTTADHFGISCKICLFLTF